MDGVGVPQLAKEEDNLLQEEDPQQNKEGLHEGDDQAMTG